MSDMIDMYRELKEYRREVKDERLRELPQQIDELVSRGHAVRELSPSGPHLRIDAKIDYWPSTGRWRRVFGRGQGTGFESLLVVLGAK